MVVVGLPALAVLNFSSNRFGEATELAKSLDPYPEIPLYLEVQSRYTWHAVSAVDFRLL